MPKAEIKCVGCGKPFPHVFMPFCDVCGDITDAFYDLDSVRLHDSANPYLRFRELLPVDDSSLLPDSAEYTPLIHAQRLGAELGIPGLYLKDETRLPTGTTKDRMAAVSLAYLYECGVRTFCTSSTGNSSTAYAHAITRFPDFTMYLFTAEAFRDRVQFASNPQIKHFVLRDASFVEAFNYAGEFARRNGFVPERGFFNLGRREGLKLAWLEAAEQAGRPIDWYVQAVSSAMGVYGNYKGARELLGMGRIDRLPRVLCVQQQSCAPMVHAWREGSDTIEPRHIVSHPSGIAKAILRGDPTRAYPYVRRIVRDSGGAMESVSETEIREARTMVESLEGGGICFSAATAVAGLIKRARLGTVSREETVLINLTGSDRTMPAGHGDGEVRWLCRSGSDWTPENADGVPGLVF